MKLTFLSLLGTATTALTLVLSPAIDLGSNLPDKRFKVDLQFSSPFLPIDPTLANIILFMSIVARGNFDDPIFPKTYNSPMYRQVEIINSKYTEARYLLWGIYLAITDMIKFTRFNDVLIKLYWEGKSVGQISIVSKTGTGDAQSIAENQQDLNRAGIGSTSTPPSLDILSTQSPQNITSDSSSIQILNPSSSIPLPLNDSLAPLLTIEFDSVPGASRISRAKAFLSFYAAILYVARFSAGDYLLPFSSEIARTDLRVHVFKTGIGCLVMLLLRCHLLRCDHDGLVLISPRDNSMRR